MAAHIADVPGGGGAAACKLRRDIHHRHERKLHSAECLGLVKPEQAGFVQELLVCANEHAGILGRLRPLAQERHHLPCPPHRLGVVDAGEIPPDRLGQRAHGLLARVRHSPLRREPVASYPDETRQFSSFVGASWGALLASPLPPEAPPAARGRRMRRPYEGLSPFVGARHASPSFGMPVADEGRRMRRPYEGLSPFVGGRHASLSFSMPVADEGRRMRRPYEGLSPFVGARHASPSFGMPAADEGRRMRRPYEAGFRVYRNRNVRHQSRRLTTSRRLRMGSPHFASLIRATVGNRSTFRMSPIPPDRTDAPSLRSFLDELPEEDTLVFASRWSLIISRPR